MVMYRTLEEIEEENKRLLKSCRELSAENKVLKKKAEILTQENQNMVDGLFGCRSNVT